MIWYLVRKYLTLTVLISLAIAVMAVLLGVATGRALVFKSLFWGGAIATFATYQLFKWENLWVLYANLGMSRYVLLGILFGAVQLLNVVLLWVLHL